MTPPDAIALLLIMLWPIIPLWWIPVHGANKLIKKLGFVIYPIIFVIWAFSAYPIYMNRLFLLGFRIDFSIVIRASGIIFAFVGIILQLWALKVLSARVITGGPRDHKRRRIKACSPGPFFSCPTPYILVPHTVFFRDFFLDRYSGDRHCYTDRLLDCFPDHYSLGRE